MKFDIVTQWVIRRRKLTVSYCWAISGTKVKKVPPDQKAEDLVEILLDATINHSKKMTPERIWSWHAALFPTGHSGILKISVGRWRADNKVPMQVVSGPIGQEKVNFEAPPAKEQNIFPMF